MTIDHDPISAAESQLPRSSLERSVSPGLVAGVDGAGVRPKVARLEASAMTGMRINPGKCEWFDGYRKACADILKVIDGDFMRR